MFTQSCSLNMGGDPFAKSLEESVSGPSGMATSAGQGSDPTGSNPSITMKQSGTEGVTASNSGQDVFEYNCEYCMDKHLRSVSALQDHVKSKTHISRMESFLRGEKKAQLRLELAVQEALVEQRATLENECDSRVHNARLEEFKKAYAQGFTQGFLAANSVAAGQDARIQDVMILSNDHELFIIS